MTICEVPETPSRSDAVVTVTDAKMPVVNPDWTDIDGLRAVLGSYRELPDETSGDADRIAVSHVG
ncbi:hypothetical protein GJ633_13385 [Halorubrum sp. CBA1125]|uniref:hypothetical protein n=1 Tax=Halorubrum sp. CBA1125 TaxID=2668072 RepID=UPI0012E95E33|nr:hypothetical protein [Halorubrum sp. CBA1125]MUW15510.1 hypothetical protein [Halorubrum sp. CBA1125]